MNKQHKTYKQTSDIVERKTDIGLELFFTFTDLKVAFDTKGKTIMRYIVCTVDLSMELLEIIKCL